MSHKRKHSSCSLRDKLEVLQRLDNGESATKLAVEFCVGKTTISDWKKNRAKIEQFCAMASSDSLDKRKTSKVSSYFKVDEALFVWFVHERDNGTTLNGPLIQEKALQLNSLLDGDPSFTASNGWLHRWKKRHGVLQLGMCSQKLHLHGTDANEYKSNLHGTDANEYKSNFPNIFSSGDGGDCTHQTYTGRDVVYAKDEAGSEESKDENPVSYIEPEPVSHIEGAAALEVALRYVKQHSKATATDVMFIQRWRDIAASSLFSSLHQTKLTEFMLKKDF